MIFFFVTVDYAVFKFKSDYLKHPVNRYIVGSDSDWSSRDRSDEEKRRLDDVEEVCHGRLSDSVEKISGTLWA